MLETIIPKNPELKRIAKLHFLVHPGYSMDSELASDVETSEEEERSGLKLLKLYEDQARTLGKDEIMIIVSASDFPMLKRHIKLSKPYVETIKKIKEILGDRAVVFAPKGHFMDDEYNRDKLKRLLSARGYFFDKAVMSEAYGEMLGVCVNYTAQGFNEGEGLKKKTVVRIGLTDNPEASVEKELGYASQTENSRLRFKK